MEINALQVAVFSAALISATPLFAANDGRDEPSSKGIGIYLDQDFFIPARNEDRDYTMGIAVEFFWEDKPKVGGTLDKALEWINGKTGMTLAGADFTIQRSLMAGSVNYTPDDLANPDPIFDDRPYSSLLYLSSKRVFTYGDKDNVLGTELQLGLLGLDVAKALQTKFHGYTRSLSDEDTPVDPKGWDHQISEGGEPTLKYRISYGQGLVKKPLFDLAMTADVSLGYQTNASLGLQVRTGKINSRFWTLPYDPINRGNFVPSPKASKEWYLWAAYRARGVAYDALLQGQFRHSDVTFDSDEIRRLVHEAGAGMTFSVQPVQLTLSLNYKSADLEGAASRSHVWGGSYLMLRW